MSQVYYRTALGDINDLFLPTSSPQYKLGEIVQVIDKDGANPNVISEFIYIRNTQTKVINSANIINETINVDGEIILIDPGSSQTAPIALVAIPQITIPVNSYGFAQIKGNAIARVTVGVAITLGAPLHLSVGTSNRLLGSVSAEASETVALALAALPSGTDLEFPVLMLGNLVAIST